MANYTQAANITEYLLEKTGSCLGVVSGKMTAKEQRALFGHFFGKGTIVINGVTETVEHYIKVSFGGDSDLTHRVKFDGSCFHDNTRF